MMTSITLQGKEFNETISEIHLLFLMKLHLKLSSATLSPFVQLEMSYVNEFHVHSYWLNEKQRIYIEA